MRWAQIAVSCPPESAEAVTAALFDTGCAGVAETGLAERAITGFLPVNDDLEARLDLLRDRLDLFGEAGLPAAGEITLRYAEDADWENAWKQYFRPARVGRRIVIKPSWEEYAAQPDDVIVELDPGMAFGTGGHPTTRLCLSALEEFVEAGMTVADLGTGSGILSIAAARLGSGPILATEIDALPRKIAAENIARLGLAGLVTVSEPSAFDAGGKWDLIVANIIADTIVLLAQSMADHLAPDGLLVASGIVDEKLPEVLSALDAAGLEVVEVREDEVWRAPICRLRR